MRSKQWKKRKRISPCGSCMIFETRSYWVNTDLPLDMALGPKSPLFGTESAPSSLRLLLCPLSSQIQGSFGCKEFWSMWTRFDDTIGDARNGFCGARWSWMIGLWDTLFHTNPASKSWNLLSTNKCWMSRLVIHDSGKSPHWISLPNDCGSSLQPIGPPMLVILKHLRFFRDLFDPHNDRITKKLSRIIWEVILSSRTNVITALPDSGCSAPSPTISGSQFCDVCGGYIILAPQKDQIVQPLSNAYPGDISIMDLHVFFAALTVQDYPATWHGGAARESSSLPRPK